MRRLDSLEQQTLNAQVTPVQVSTSKTWVSIASKTEIKGKSGKNLPEPSSQILNKFRPATIVLQTPPGFTGFDTVSPSSITNMINNVLNDLGTLVDSKSIELQGVKQLPSKDLQIYTSTHSEAGWLLLNKHHWTAQLNTTLKTHPA
ncbi:hypothetical protein O181_020903 [Austropuccinia psidii MF-1]|uniref:Uncharacterized protein n=1 Tax=Austropuccinia psidii MF-1 TaxID=1389203 RepID=A0A9Q3CCA5_9BASI|nr:hypothetical protein [Austropuccinia psidii MF-1]